MILKKTYTKNNNEIVLIEKGYNDSKTILLVGVIHGEEPQGKALIEKYLKLDSPYKNKLLFIPCLNPDGMALGKRQNSNKVDLNRNFPTKNWGENKDNNPKTADPEYFGGDTPASEIETKFVIEIIEEYKPDLILTLHAPYKVVNYDGPAEKIAKEISKIIDYPTTSDIGYPTPGSFGNYAGVERNIPIITLELDEEKTIEELFSPVKKIFDLLANY